MHVQISQNMGEQEAKNGCINWIIRKLPELHFFCCCMNCSLRTGVLWIGWTSLVLSIFFNFIIVLSVKDVATPGDYTVPPYQPWLPYGSSSTVGPGTAAKTTTTTATTTNRPTKHSSQRPTTTQPPREIVIVHDNGVVETCSCHNGDCSDLFNCAVHEPDARDNSLYVRQNHNLINDTGLRAEVEEHPYYTGAVVLVFFMSFSFMTVTSILLLLGVYHHNLSLVKIWLDINIITWIVAVIVHITILIVMLVYEIWDFADGLFNLCLMVINFQLYYYCIDVVKSYYVHERIRRSSHHTKIEEQMIWEAGCTMENMIRKLPQIRYFCCCASYTLRSGVITIAWYFIIASFFGIIWSTSQFGDAVQRKELVFKEFQPFLFIDKNRNLEGLAWAVLCTEMTINWIFFYMAIFLLFGAYSKNLKFIRIWLKIHIILVILSLAFSTSCYIIAPMLHYPLFSNILITIFGMILYYGFQFYVIVLIKSHYVREWVLSHTNYYERETDDRETHDTPKVKSTRGLSRLSRYESPSTGPYVPPGKGENKTEPPPKLGR